MARIRLQHSRGLWLAGLADRVPAGALRRALGVSPIDNATVRARQQGVIAAVVAGTNIHTISDLAGGLFVGHAGNFLRNGVLIASGLSGARLRVVRAAPTSGVADVAYVAGGGKLFKVKQDGTVLPWGLTAPADGMTATVSAPATKTISTCDNATGWTISSSDGGAGLFPDFGLKQEGSSSVRVQQAKETAAYATVPLALDLSTITTFFGVATSPDEDWIALDFRCNRPRHLESIQVIFDVGDGGSQRDTYSREVLVDDPLRRANAVRFAGLGDIAGVRDDEAVFLAQATPSVQFRLSSLELMGRMHAADVDDTWITLLIPKASFVRAGTAGSWATVARLTIAIRTNTRGGLVSNIDNIRLIGGVGMQGDYQYHVTFLDPESGVRSNGNATAVEALDVTRSFVTLTNIPTYTLPAGSPAGMVVPTIHRELWRTLGNGALFWKCLTIADNTTTSTVDLVADYPGLHGTATAYLTAEELPRDNIVPDATIADVATDAGRLFLTRDSAHPSRVYWSPAGRSEAVQGFVDPSNGLDPVQTVVMFDRRRYAVTTRGWYELAGTGQDDIFIPLLVEGVPGTTRPFSVVPCGSYGIVYQASDGALRLFDGARAERLGYDALSPIAEGESTGLLPTFDFELGEFFKEEYWGASGTAGASNAALLAYHLKRGAWRQPVDGTMTALYADRTAGQLYASDGSSGLFVYESGIITPSGVAFAFDVEWAHVPSDEGRTLVIQYLYIDWEPAGNVLFLSRIVNGVEIEMGTIGGTTGRQRLEFALADTADTFGVRLHGTVIARGAATAPNLEIIVEIDAREAEPATSGKAEHLATLLAGGTS